MQISRADLTRTNQDQYDKLKDVEAMLWVTYTCDQADQDANGGVGQAKFTVKDLKEITGFLFTGWGVNGSFVNDHIDTNGGLLSIANGNEVTVTGVSGQFDLKKNKKLFFIFTGH